VRKQKKLRLRDFFPSIIATMTRRQHSPRPAEAEVRSGSPRESAWTDQHHRYRDHVPSLATPTERTGLLARLDQLTVRQFGIQQCAELLSIVSEKACFVENGGSRLCACSAAWVDMEAKEVDLMTAVDTLFNARNVVTMVGGYDAFCKQVQEAHVQAVNEVIVPLLGMLREEGVQGASYVKAKASEALKAAKLEHQEVMNDKIRIQEAYEDWCNVDRSDHIQQRGRVV